MIKTKLFIYSPSNSPFLFFPLFIFCCLLLFCGKSFSKMSMGFNLWALGWDSSTSGLGPEYNYFAPSINWTTTTNPWNPTFISELEQAKPHCLRFMDWGVTKNSGVTKWNQRIPKTANHYLKDNNLPQTSGGGPGVAYEWTGRLGFRNRYESTMSISYGLFAKSNL